MAIEQTERMRKPSTARLTPGSPRKWRLLPLVVGLERCIVTFACCDSCAQVKQAIVEDIYVAYNPTDDYRCCAMSSKAKQCTSEPLAAILYMRWKVLISGRRRGHAFHASIPRNSFMAGKELLHEFGNFLLSKALLFGHRRPCIHHSRPISLPAAIQLAMLLTYEWLRYLPACPPYSMLAPRTQRNTTTRCTLADHSTRPQALLARLLLNCNHTNTCDCSSFQLPATYLSRSSMVSSRSLPSRCFEPRCHRPCREVPCCCLLSCKQTGRLYLPLLFPASSFFLSSTFPHTQTARGKHPHPNSIDSLHLPSSSIMRCRCQLCCTEFK